MFPEIPALSAAQSTDAEVATAGEGKSCVHQSAIQQLPLEHLTPDQEAQLREVLGYFPNLFSGDKLG